MSKFNDLMGGVRTALKGLLNETNVEQVASITKSLDDMEHEHASTEAEVQSAKDNLVKYVKEYAFKDKQVDAGLDKPVSLDDAFADAFKEN